jgi:hypothetical protein
MDPAYIQVVREAVGKIWKPDQTDKGFQNIEKAQMARREALEKVEIRRVI